MRYGIVPARMHILGANLLRRRPGSRAKASDTFTRDRRRTALADCMVQQKHHCLSGDNTAKEPGCAIVHCLFQLQNRAIALSVTEGIVPGTVPTHPVRCRYGREHGQPAIPNAPAGGIAQKWKEGTLTLAYLPTSQMELRGEVRYDKSDKSVFGMVSGAPKDSQSSVGVEALYKF